MRKKVLKILFVITLIFLSSTICYGYDFPDEFWPVNKSYTQAVEAKNNSDIIKS